MENQNEYKGCRSSDHFFNMIVDGKCFSCGAVWGLSSDAREVLDDERTLDAIVGVGDQPIQNNV